MTEKQTLYRYVPGVDCGHRGCEEAELQFAISYGMEPVEPNYEAAIPYVRQACQMVMALRIDSYTTGADVERAEKEFNALVKQAVDAAYGGGERR